MKREDLEAREFGLIIASSNFPFYAAPEADAVMDAMEARIKELEEDIQLIEKKTDLQADRIKELETENAEMKAKLRDNGDWICNGNEEQSSVDSNQSWGVFG